MYARNYAKNMELERGTILHNLDRVKEFLNISDANLDGEEESVSMSSKILQCGTFLSHG